MGEKHTSRWLTIAYFSSILLQLRHTRVLLSVLFDVLGEVEGWTTYSLFVEELMPFFVRVASVSSEYHNRGNEFHDSILHSWPSHTMGVLGLWGEPANQLIYKDCSAMIHAFRAHGRFRREVGSATGFDAHLRTMVRD
jgi:hypothetical protein